MAAARLGRGGRLALAGTSSTAIAAANLLAAALLAAAPASAQQANPFELRGGQAAGPRDITIDPRLQPPEPAFGAPGRLPPSPASPSAGASAGGGPPVAQEALPPRRRSSRASRPVQGRVVGGQRSIRPEARSVSRLPVEEPPPPLRRGVAPSRIVATPPAAPDALRDYPARRPARPEDDPWAPLGLRLGTFVATPSVTQSFGYDSNPNRTAGSRRGSAISRTEGEVAIRSDWAAHSFTGNLRGGYSYFFSEPSASRPDLTGAANLRLNLGRDTDLDFDLRSSLDTQRPGSPNLGANVRERPNVYTYGGSAGITQRFSRVSVNLRGSVERTSYDDARDTAGLIVRQSDRNAVTYGARARLGYELTPGFTPFVEASIDNRVFDDRLDSGGFRRSSTGVGGRVGSTFEMTRLLTGEASIGYQARSYDDPRLRDLKGLVGDASLAWAVTPLTTVTLRGTTDIADSTLPNVSGSFSRRASVEIAHALRRNWTITGFAGLTRNEFQGIRLTEDNWQFGVRSEYRLTRNVSIRASYVHERLNSTTPGADYTANTFLMGLRFSL